MVASQVSHAPPHISTGNNDQTQPGRLDLINDLFTPTKLNDSSPIETQPQAGVFDLGNVLAKTEPLANEVMPVI